MDTHLLEVKDGVLHSWDGNTHQVHGGAYLPPAAYLTTNAELARLRQREQDSSTWVPLVLGVALLGLGAGFWLGRRSAED